MTDEHERSRGPQIGGPAGGTERVNHKLRTRQALVDAARDLLAAGTIPTLDEVAEQASVPTTTAHRYFASVDALITEVFFDRVFPSVDDVMADVGDDPLERVLAVEAAVNDTMLHYERAARVIVRNAIDAILAAGDDGSFRRGRRQRLIIEATEPLEGVLEPDVLRRLRNGLALVIGPEAVLAARDVCHLGAAEAREVTRWAAEALVTHAIAGRDGPHPTRIVGHD